MIDTVHIGAGSYPSAPEPNDETKFEIVLSVISSDIFPETWDDEEKKEYIKNQVKEYIYNSDDIEVHDIVL